MRKLIRIITCFALLLRIPLYASAVNHYVVDNAGLLTAEEAAALEERSIEFKSISDMELVILTVDSLGSKTAMAYADDYFDAHYGENGILLLIAITEQEWYISTTGTSIEAFTETELMDMEDGIMMYLPDGEYNEAFNRFLSDAEFYWNEEGVSNFTVSLILAIPVGAIIAGIVLLIMRSMMNTKTSQRDAGAYTVDNSYHLHTHQDLFLYSNISKRRRPKDPPKSSGGTHTSSSGRSHGGRGGSF